MGLLQRDHYDLGVSFINDLVRGSIEPKPYWVTELQGGNNIYSGVKAMEPTANDIAQWTWTSIGAGADRVIYWLLNARRKGVEAGEWSMLDFQQQPSARLTTASRIATGISQRDGFFAHAKPVRSNVTLLLSLDTMEFETVFHQEAELGRLEDPARGSDAHIQEALGFYEALSMLGGPPDVKLISDYDWTSHAEGPRVVIVPDARVLSTVDLQRLGTFVEQGNFVLVSGLTGFYGLHGEALSLSGFPLAGLTGASLKEVHLTSEIPYLGLGQPQVKLPSRLWVSTIGPGSAVPIAEEGPEVIATMRSTTRGGKVLWIPSPIGLGAWLTNAGPLANYLQSVLPAAHTPATFHFVHAQRPCMLRVLQHEGHFLTVVTNGTAKVSACAIKIPARLTGESLWGPRPKLKGSEAEFELEARGTAVTMWQ